MLTPLHRLRCHRLTFVVKISQKLLDLRVASTLSGSLFLRRHMPVLVVRIVQNRSSEEHAGG